MCATATVPATLFAGCTTLYVFCRWRIPLRNVTSQMRYCFSLGAASLPRSAEFSTDAQPATIAATNTSFVIMSIKSADEFN
jgi:hypothetical protein